MGENSRHLSPISLLTSPPPPPPLSLAKFEGGNDFVYSDVDVMGTMGNGGENNTHSILGKMATVEFLGYYVSVASNAFARSLNLPSQLSINVLRWCVRYGVPVIEVLGENYKHFNQLYAIIERGELKVALSFLNLVEDCIKHQPEFACKFLNNENVVEAMITCVQCVGPEEEEEDVDKLTLSARSASCIAFLWEASKSKDGDSGSGSGSSKNGLGDAVEKIRNFSNQSFLKKMADVLMNTRTGTGTSTITNQNAIIHKKKLIATALRVLAIEIHSESKLSPVITEFLEAASKTNKYEVWTEEFMIFSDSTFYELSEGCDVNAVFNKSDLVVPPASFRSGTISGDDNEIFDCELVSEFMRVSRNGNHDLVVGCLMNYNTIWALASAEATLIRSWRRFMEVSELSTNTHYSQSHTNYKTNMIARRRCAFSTTTTAASAIATTTTTTTKTTTSYQVIIKVTTTDTTTTTMPISRPHNSPQNPAGSALPLARTTTTHHKLRYPQLRPVSLRPSKLLAPTSWATSAVTQWFSRWSRLLPATTTPTRTAALERMHLRWWLATWLRRS